MRYILIVLILLMATPTGAEDHCVFVIEKIGIYPAPIDPENITPEEQVLIDAWVGRYSNYWGLYGKLDRSQDWLLSDDYQDIMQPGQGPEVTKAGRFGILHDIPCDRILKANPGTWFENKVAVLRDNGWQLRGWTIPCIPGQVGQDIRAFLEGKNYVYVETE